MSLRIGTTEPISGALVIGQTGLGILGSAIPSAGTHGAGYLYNDLTLPADAGKEVRGLIVTPPSAGTFFAYEDSSFTLTGAPDGTYSFLYRLFADGADLGTATASVTIGAASTVSGVTVSPTTATGSQTFTASVAGTGSPSQAVNWSASAGSINSSGVFTAPAQTSSTQTVTITATSVQDGSKSGTATVTIAAAAAGSTVTGVSLNPTSASGSQQFVATVNGTNGPSQAVTWAASAGSISNTGSFVAPAATSSVQTITITATSVQDTSKSATATVTIAAAAPTTTRSISVPLQSGGSPAVNLSGLTWAFFDQSTPGALNAPSSKGTGATTNGSGVLNLTLPSCTLAAGGVGYLIVSDTNGTAAFAAHAFQGAVQVS